MRCLLLVVLGFLSACASPFAVQNYALIPTGHVSPWNPAMPVVVMADGSFHSEPDPEWYPYFGSSCAHVNCGAIPDPISLRVVQCGDAVAITAEQDDAVACESIKE